MVISVDHGNKAIKTPHFQFTSGLIVSDGKPAFKTDYLNWEGKYYTLTEQRIAYMRDKTEDSRFFALTLFAIANELEYQKIPETLEPIDITLLVGLPPAHYDQLHRQFEDYFIRKHQAIVFDFNNRYYSIRINKVYSYPQGFAAAVTQYATLKAYRVAYIIDIGGFTIDLLKLRHGQPDLSVVESLERGVITLFNKIASQCNSRYSRLVEDGDIEDVIMQHPTTLPGEIQQLIRTMANDFITEFFHFLRECGIDTLSSNCIFIGGGSLLLKSMIERNGQAAFPIFISDTHANACGYELLYQSEVSANG